VLLEEAKWLGERILVRRDDALFPFVNIGSSTGEFRSTTQPHIDEKIFAPLRRRGGEIRHVDIKAAPGVDLVGDILDPDFRRHLHRSGAQCVMISNLLEHVMDPAGVAQAVLDLVSPGGLIIVSGPHRFPFHPDPIDNGFRPTIREVAALFPSTRVLESQVVVSKAWRPWSHLGAGRFNSLLYLARLALPFYRPRAWRRRMDSAPYVFRRPSAYAVVLEKG
jgi:SAM-dependent methyltransferase